MKIKGKSAYVFDIEVFPNVFHCTVKDTETDTLYKFECSERKNQIEEMCKFFLEQDVYFVGYNNIHYDDPIINYCIEFFNNSNYSYRKICESIFNMSKVITTDKNNTELWKRWKYAKNFFTLDLLTMLYSQALRVSLKEMQVTMMYKNVQEFSVDWTEPLPISRIDEMIDYNINDVDSTTELLKQCKKDIDIRVSIEESYGIECLSKDGVGIGVDLLKHHYLEKTGESWWDLKDKRSPMDYIPLKDVILPNISFKTPMLQKLLEEMKGLTVSPGRNGWNKKFLLGNLVVSMGVGGIHSINEPEKIVPAEDELLLDSDATSLYPSLIIQYGFVPPHLNKEAFVEIYSTIYRERVADKKAGRKLESETKKLTLNSVTGNYQNEYSWLYSPFAVMQIRMNGQLILLMLCERLLELGAIIHQVNTDGVLYTLKKDKKEALDQMLIEFKAISKLNFETESFENFYQLAVNDYFGLQPDGKVKEKGCFITSVIRGKGLTPKIIPKAVIEYFLHGTKPEEFIKNHKDIKDFLMSEKTGKQWHVEYNGKPQQRINRFYASTNGYFLYKWKLKENERQYQNMLVASGVTLLNDFKDLKEDPKINYKYYIDQAYEIISKFKYKQLSLF